ncbi:hypothetical protein II906_03265, partial [bacterium]|nr:hypothetical protein [bacterium]
AEEIESRINKDENGNTIERSKLTINDLRNAMTAGLEIEGLSFEQIGSYTVDENVKDKEYLHKMILSGEFLIQEKKEKGWEDEMWQGNGAFSEVNDTSDDAKAEAEYEAATRELNRRDKLLEMRLEQVQTQEQAVEKEIESVKNIIGKNIENSFKTFSG